MQVGGAHLEGVLQHFLQKAHDGRVVHFVVDLGGGGFFLSCFLVLELAVGKGRLVFAPFGGRAGLQHLDQFVELHYHPFDPPLGGKFDFVRRVLVRWVGRGDHQRVVAFT